MTCPDCNGTGKYVGLTATEPCRACAGTGIGRTFTPAEFRALVEADGGSVEYVEGMPFFEVDPKPIFIPAETETDLEGGCRVTLEPQPTAQEMAERINSIPGMKFHSGSATAKFE